MEPTPDRLPPGALTYEDYAALPDDGKRYEILEGELFVSPAPVPLHQRVSRNLQRLLDRHVEEDGLGEILYAPIDLILSNTTVAEPDIVFIRRGRESIVTRRAIEAPVDLAVEILSPSTARTDRTTKATVYARFGIPHYWILDPEERIFESYDLDAGAYRLALRAEGDAVARAEPLPGLEIALAKVWA
jgi:Uma2 family endonuclease